jgi:DNA-directed RNA polymerase subunit RPC12/RpoP
MEHIGKVIDNKTIAAKFNTQSDLYWTFKNDTDSYVLDDYKSGDEITLEFAQNEDLFLIHKGERIELLRDFNYAEPEIQNAAKIKSFDCPSCGVPLPLNNIEITENTDHNHSIVCEYCNSNITISDEMKEMIIQNKEVEEKHAEVFKYLNEHFKRPIKDRIFFILNLIPYCLFIIQIAFILILAFFNSSRSWFVDEFLYEWLFEDYNFALFFSLPAFVISSVIIFITNRNSFSDIDLLFSFFRPKANAQNQYFCRNCGNPLKSTKVPEFIVCPYCQTHNVISLSNQKFQNISNKLNIKLEEVQNLAKLYDKKVKSYTIGLFVGFVIFYGAFIGYAFGFEDIGELHWISKFIVLPFVVFLMLHLFNSFALVSSSSYESAIPGNYKKKEEEETKAPLKTRIFTAAFGYSKLIIGVLFFIAMFFVKNI